MIRLDGFPTAEGLLDLHVRRGEIVLLQGPNGCGKTSLLRALAGLSTPLLPASVRLGGSDPAALSARALREACALSPQDPRDALVGLTLAGEARLRERTLPAALSPLAAREVATLSSGEARRVALALAEAPVLLLDEPAEGLDAEGRAALLDAVRAASRIGCVVAVDHGGLLAPLATRVVLLGAADAHALPPIPPARGPVLLDAPAATVRGLALPPVRLGPGFYALTGPNGAGKSTLLRRLAGVDGSAPAQVAGSPARPGATLRMAPTHARDALTRERVQDEISGAEPEVRAAFVPSSLDARHPFALSGGEAQRVLLAKVLGRPAPVYLLDEPEAHLDAQGRRALRDVLARRASEGSCILAATHDPALLALAHGQIGVGA